MATQLGGAARRRRPSFTQAPEAGTRHPAVAVAMTLPIAILLIALFGGWEQLATQTKAVADLIGR
ncbi:hypothetical protein GCM10010193_46710 [Kitasatospora atroaurantiaca]|uniref:Uncharacterized protein n=1 Tax=Kitasatospora atroaurantiaca TaxID=285545 RepID=A0A561EZA6_9ACTN|nr:hypothetical protein [Kitasatospora atroaurantiaca]TWE20948.1 hypothetical protein FB465_6108 [Kitasatospora atroaurantiaca]